MRRILLGVFSLVAPAVAVCQGYQAPAMAMHQLVDSDPAFNDGIDYADKHGGNPTIQKWVIEEAAKGRLMAQIYLGERYIPVECRHVEDASIRAGDCVEGSDDSGIELKPSFEQAFYWLNKASAQGAGEATEILAQQTERMILQHLPTTATDADVAKLHALARKQGFDEEQISVSCSVVDRKNLAPLHLSSKRGQYDLPEAQIMEARKVMPHGAIGDVQEQTRTNEWMQHPEGPAAKVWLLLDHPITHDIVIAMPLRTEVVAVQRGDGVVVIPSNAPHSARTIILHLTDKGEIKALVQKTDGGVDKDDCVDSLSSLK
jgi:hypothetical protein